MQDKFGIELIIGDVVIYTTSTKGGGGMHIGAVDSFTPQGGVTIKSRRERNQLAHEVGAPPVKRIGNRYVFDAHAGRSVREEYEYESPDYTPTGVKIYRWTKRTIWISSNIVTVRTADWRFLPHLRDFTSLDYSKEIPDGPTFQD